MRLTRLFVFAWWYQLKLRSRSAFDGVLSLAYPIFFAMDAAVLSSGGALPAVLRPLADVLSSADYVVFGLLAGKDGNFELALDADCMSETSASGLRDTISGIVGHAGSTFSMLHNGRVQSQGRSVRGRWTLDRNAVQSLIAP